VPVSIYYFIEPYGAFDVGIDTDVTDQIVFFVVALLTAIFFEKLRREQYRATLLQRVSESRFDLLVENDAELREAIFMAKAQSKSNEEDQ
jgi:K+-sensing histidine kinase KdpD